MTTAQAIPQDYRYSHYVMLGWYYLLISSSSLVIFSFIDSNLWVWLTLLGIGVFPSFLTRKKIYDFSGRYLYKLFESTPTLVACFQCVAIWIIISVAGFIVFRSYGGFYSLGSAIFLFLLFREILTYASAGVGS